MATIKVRGLRHSPDNFGQLRRDKHQAAWDALTMWRRHWDIRQHRRYLAGKRMIQQWEIWWPN